VVEEYCRRNAIEFEWKGDRLKHAFVAVVAKHPQTGEMVGSITLLFHNTGTDDAKPC